MDRLSGVHDHRHACPKLVLEIPRQPANGRVDEHVKDTRLVNARQAHAPRETPRRMIHGCRRDELDLMPRRQNAIAHVRVFHVRQRKPLVEAAHVVERVAPDGEVARPQDAAVEIDGRGLTRRRVAFAARDAPLVRADVGTYRAVIRRQQIELGETVVVDEDEIFAMRARSAVVAVRCRAAPRPSDPVRPPQMRRDEVSRSLCLAVISDDDVVQLSCERLRAWSETLEAECKQLVPVARGHDDAESRSAHVAARSGSDAAQWSIVEYSFISAGHPNRAFADAWRCRRSSSVMGFCNVTLTRRASSPSTRRSARAPKPSSRYRVTGKSCAITGRPCASASTYASPNPSRRDASANASAAR